METKTPKLEVTEENLKKAYEIIGEPFPGLMKSKESDLNKSINKEDEESEEKHEEKAPPKDQKLDESEEKPEDESEDESEEKEIKKSQKNDKSSSDKKDEDEESKIFKSITFSVNQKIEALATINQHLANKIEKSLTSLNRLNEIEKDVDALSRKVEQQGKEIENNIEKSLNSAKEKDNTILKSIDSLDNRVAKIERTPNTRKSIKDLQYVEKSQESNQLNNNENETVLSVSRNRKEISNLLLQKSMIGTGNQTNKQFENAVLDFETSGKLSKSIMNDLSKNDNIRFTS